MSSYSATKWAVIGFTQAAGMFAYAHVRLRIFILFVAQEWGKHGITVNGARFLYELSIASLI
jgi:NAD(P)-dependent dehydrogenase (short-subunit alcohol dehydrogenase family)